MNKNLFEGIQILGAEELEKSLLSTETTEDTGLEITSSNPESEEGQILASSEVEEVNVETNEGDASVKTSETVTPQGETAYKALIKELYDKKVITGIEAEKLEEIPGTAEALQGLIEATTDTKLKDREKSWKESFSGAKKMFLEIEDAFTDADKAIQVAQELDFLESLTQDEIDADKDLQKRLYFKDLTENKNYTKEEAIEEVNDAEKLEKLSKKASESSLRILEKSKEFVEKEREKLKQLEKEDAESQTQKFDTLMDNIEKKEKFIDGLELTKEIREKLKANIVKPVYKDDKSGKEFNSLMYKQMKNPVEFEMLINYYDTLGFFNMDDSGQFKPDIEKLKKVAKTEAVKDLDRVISREQQQETGAAVTTGISPKTGSILDLFDEAFDKKKK